MKRSQSPESESDGDQELSLEFQDGFFDLLGESDPAATGRLDDPQPAARRRDSRSSADASRPGTSKNVARERDGHEKPSEEPSNALDGRITPSDGAAPGPTKHKSNPSVRKHLTSASNWSDFGIARSLIKVPPTAKPRNRAQAVFDMGYEAPSIIQSKVIPVALEGKDLLATAETGSGKSAAFLIPTLQRLITAGVIRQKEAPHAPGHAQRVGTKALILLPTRELAAQCFEVFLGLTKYLNQSGVLLTGGVPVKEQEAKLRRVPYIVFATPGKVLDVMLNSKGIHMDAIEIVVLDEADRLLDLGFKDELTQILKLCNKDRQTMLFSATLTEATKDIVPVSLVNPIYIQAAPRITVARTLKCEIMQLPSDELREAAALYLCKRRYPSRTILFFQTKRAAHRAALVFRFAGLKCGELHGDLSQSKRFEQVELFRTRQVDFLMASELASRGLDIPGVRAVINVHVPTDAVRFVHRVGRTARMGEAGTAITFYVEKERTAVKGMLKKVAAEGSGFEKHKVKLSAAALKNYKQKIDELEPQIKEVLLGEQVEKEMRRAESAIKRGLDADGEEPRVWFRSKKEKRAASKNEFIETQMRAERDAASAQEVDAKLSHHPHRRGASAPKPVGKAAKAKRGRAVPQRAGRK
ncbi:DEAD-box family helicase [Babesia caballi]|uniref:DEAD-box family helicase n=1 Tax=Babesia caballi TaxID=5871 RepID=A0AAV4LMX3_BABCB|nr:DEAD-box family helicase [Babesia caballi]